MVGSGWLYYLGAGETVFLLRVLWEAVAGARWADRVGKGIRTAPPARW